MEKSLDELLSDDAGDSVVGPARDESGRFASKGVEPEPEQETPVEEPEAGPPPAEPDKLPQEEYAVVRKIRDENKALKDQLDQLSRQIQAVQQPTEPQPEPPTLWEDENAWGGNLVNQAVQQSSYASKLQMSEMLAAQAIPDFQEVWEPMNRFLIENPAVAQKAASERHPWAFAYKAYKNAAVIQELAVTDIDSLKAKLREEVMAEFQAQAPAARPGLPPTLSTERSSGSRTGPAWSGPKSMDDLLG